jgi:hypothetical protein
MEKGKVQTIDISNFLSKDKFEKIVGFVLKNGDRKTYCNIYNNSPHYKLEDFNIYLNPVEQKINIVQESLSGTISDYNSITIYDCNADGKFRYYYIRLADEQVFLDSYRYQNEEEFNFTKKAFLRIYYPKIEREIWIKEQ